MNQSQRDYLARRVDDIAKEALQALKDDDASWEIKPLSPVELLSKIANGTIPMKSADACVDNHRYMGLHYHSLDECVQMTEHERKGKRTAQYFKQRRAILEEAQVLKDRANLGAASDALKALQDFEAKYAPAAKSEE